jgi:hypothetical protein
VEGGPVKIKGRRANGIVKGSSTLEEYLEWRNDTASDSERMSSNSLGKRDLSVKEPAKRQSEDDYFQINFEALGIRYPTEYEDGPRLPPGVTDKWEVSETQTFSVTTSVEMGAAFEVFSASVGLEVSESESFTVTEGLEFAVGCKVQGQVRFYPLYNYYDILSWPSQTYIDIWIPVINGDRRVNGEIEITCIG